MHAARDTQLPHGSTGGSPQPSTLPPPLRGRQRHCATLELLIESARLGRSGVLVIRGEAGIGKSALLEYVRTVASGVRVLRVAGVESEMELAYAGLHQLCSPLLADLDKLPEPQAVALGTAFGLRSGRPPDRLLMGLSLLTLLSEAAQQEPLLCLVDDAQWLDQASIRALTFVARRIDAESLLLIFAARTDTADESLSRLPELVLEGLGMSDAAALMEAASTGPLDERVRRRILAESHGNPLALVELPRWSTSAELAFGGELHRSRTLTTRMEQGFRRQLVMLPHETRQLLVIASADPLGDPALLWRAAALCDIPPEAIIPAQTAGLIVVSDGVRFRHPIVRSVVYRFAGVTERQSAHHALALVTDAGLDPDRRAWHRAHAATAPDESVAAELERSAGRAVAQGGLAAAAAFLRKAAQLTPAPGRRAQRQLDAAQAMVHAGMFEAALTLLAAVANETLTEVQSARHDVLCAQIGFAHNRGNEGLTLLVAAAGRLEAVDIELALESYVDALTATLFAGRLASGIGAKEVAEAARSAPTPESARRGDRLLKAVSVRFADGYPPAAPLLHGAVQAFDTEELSLEEGVRFMWLSAVVASDLWDERAWDRLTSRHLRIVREAGALSALPLALNTRVFVDLYLGDLVSASATVRETSAVTEAAEASMVPYGAVGLAAFRGHESEARPLIATAMSDVVERGEGIGVALTNWAQAVLCNGLGQYAEALDAARVSAACPEEMGVSNWGLVELVEAGVRAGDLSAAVAAFERLREMTRASGTAWALGLAARCEAQLHDGIAAEELYREAVERLASTDVRVDAARAQLLYGEWLRRAGRRQDAREQLRTAHETLSGMGMDAFAERARRELAATGESVRKRTIETERHLTPQEMHIARLAGAGLTNSEIGRELFISPRTVEWHLRKVFLKLGVAARRDLNKALIGALP